MPKYEGRFTPPAPIAAVSIRDVDRSKLIRNVTMFIDSGTDLTLLPASSVSRLGLRIDPQRRFELLAFNGGESQTVLVECELLFSGQVFRGEYGILDADEGLLGRDVLNNFAMVLDGPALEWRIVPSAK